MKSKQLEVQTQQKEIELARSALAQQRLNVQQEVQKEVELERAKFIAEAMAQKHKAASGSIF